MLSFNCFYNISSVPIYGSVCATILLEIDDQYCAVLNAKTSDAGTYTEVRFGQFEKVLADICATLVTLLRYNSFKLVHSLKVASPIYEHNGILTIDSPEQYAKVLQVPKNPSPKDLHNGKLMDFNVEQNIKAWYPIYEQNGNLIDCNKKALEKALSIKVSHNSKLTYVNESQ